MPRPRPACGTDGGYRAHRRRNEDACDPCKKAHSAFSLSHDREYRRPYQAAWGRALRRLARRYPYEFADLLAEERAKQEQTERAAARRAVLAAAVNGREIA